MVKLIAIEYTPEEDTAMGKIKHIWTFHDLQIKASFYLYPYSSYSPPVIVDFIRKMINSRPKDLAFSLKTKLKFIVEV